MADVTIKGDYGCADGTHFLQLVLLCFRTLAKHANEMTDLTSMSACGYRVKATSIRRQPLVAKPFSSIKFIAGHALRTLDPPDKLETFTRFRTA